MQLNVNSALLVCVLLVLSGGGPCGVLAASSASASSSVLVSSRGVSLQRPLYLGGRNVDAVLDDLLSRMATAEQRAEQQQIEIDELRRRNATLTVQMEGLESHLTQLFEQAAALNGSIAQQDAQLHAFNNTVVYMQQQIAAGNTTQSAQLGELGDQLQQWISLLYGRQDNSSLLLQQQLDELRLAGDVINRTLSSRVWELTESVSSLTQVMDTLLTPVAVAATAGSSRATVSWSLQNYTVTSEPGGHTCASDGLNGEQQCTVTGLTNNQPYTFRVQLQSAAGAGRPSFASNEVTPTLDCRLLSVSVDTEGGSVMFTPSNSVGCSAGYFVPGESVRVVAVPRPGYGVVGWSGDAQGDTEYLTVRTPEAGASVSYTVSFGLCYSLSVQASTGGNVSTSKPNSAGCQLGEYAASGVVNLIAEADVGYSFVNWTGTRTGGTGTALWKYAMPAAAAQQRAVFLRCLLLNVAPMPATLGVTSVTPSNSDGCPLGFFLVGSTLTLTATAHAGNGFASWSGTQTSAAPVWSYTMGSSTATQVANFGACLGLGLASSNAAWGSVTATPSKHPGCVTEGYYLANTLVTLVASAASGYTLTAWTGSSTAAGTLTSWTYTMPSTSASQTGVFAACMPLTLNQVGATTGTTVSTLPDHSFQCSSQHFVSGAAVQLVATAGSGKSLTAWSGSGTSGSAPTLPFTMPTAAATVTATFAVCYSLTVSSSSGSGTLSASSPTPYNCAPSSFVSGASVQVSASAPAGWTFVGWSGALSSASAVASFTMPSGDVSAVASIQRCFALSISKDVRGGTGGGGTLGTPSPTRSFACDSGAYVAGATVSVPIDSVEAGYSFATWAASWAGQPAGSSSGISVSMPAAAATLTASFVRCWSVSVSPAGTCTGCSASSASSVSATANNYACAANTFAEGATVRVAPTLPADGSGTVTAWSSNVGSVVLAGYPSSQTFTMPTSAITVTVTFAQCVALSLTAAPSSMGAVTVNVASSYACGARMYVAGTVVTATATPNAGYVLQAWSGAVSSTAASVSLTMGSSAASLTATFRTAPVPASALSTTATMVWGRTALGVNNDDAYGGIHLPQGVCFNPLTGEMAVPDGAYHRVIVYAAPSSSGGTVLTTAPVRLLGQADYSSRAVNRNGAIAANTLNTPFTCVYDATGGMYLSDRWNHRVLYIPQGASAATKVWGQGGRFDTGAIGGGTTGFQQPTGLAVDASQNLYVADTNNHRVLYFPAGALTASRVYGQADSFVTTGNRAGARGLDYPYHLSLDPLDGGLVIADSGNYRVVYVPANQTTATGVWGMDTVTSTNRGSMATISASLMRLPYGVVHDAYGNLVVADGECNRVLFFARGESAATVLWGQSFYTSTSAGSAADKLNHAYGVALDLDGALVIADTDNWRVVKYAAV